MTLSPRILLFSVIVLASLLSVAQVADEALDLSVAQNIEKPSVPRKAETYVRTAMDQLRRHLVKNGLDVKTIRDGEVLQVTIPCSSLFGIGSVELKASAVNELRKLSAVVREPHKYKVLVAVHTDDTGDNQYADSISASRANAIDDGLWHIAGEKDTNVIPYGIGKDEPIVPNTSRNNRERNRRVEIYIIPDIALIEMSGVKIKK